MNTEKTVITRFKAIDEMSSVAKQIRKQYAVMKTDVNELGKAINRGLLVGAGGMLALTVASIKSADSLQQNKIAFQTMLGSAEKAGRLLKDIKKFSLATPFENQELVEGAKKLLAYGFAQEKIIPTMKSLGDISAGLGMDKLPYLIRAVGQVNSKGKLMGQELLQINETGLDLAPTLAKIRGVSEKTFRSKDITKWKITAEEVELAIKRIAESRYHGLMEKQSKTITGMMSNAKELGTTVLQQIGGINEKGVIQKGGLLDVAQTKLGDLMKWVNNNGPVIDEWTKKFSGELGTALDKTGQGISSTATAISKLDPTAVKLFGETLAIMAGASAVSSFVSTMNPAVAVIGLLAVNTALAYENTKKLMDLLQIKAENKALDEAIGNVKSKTEKQIDSIEGKIAFNRITNPLNSAKSNAPLVSEKEMLQNRTFARFGMSALLPLSQQPNRTPEKKEVTQNTTTTVNINGTVLGVHDLQSMIRNTVKEEQDKSNKLAIMNLQ